MLQTEFAFVLPHGYVDAEGTVHREGTMRLATAEDEIAPHRDPRVQANPAYVVIIVLSRVVTRLGDLPAVNPKVIENLFAGDLAFLERLYQQVNEAGHDRLAVTCPHCDEHFEVAMASSGE